MSNNIQQIKVQLNWLIRRQMAEVLSIEAQSFEFPWSEEDFIRCLRQRNAIGMVAEVDERIVGFMIYELQLGRLHVINFAVHPEFRRRGVGTAMINKLIGKLSLHRRRHLRLEVRETNLDAQLFFRARGFLAVSMLRDFYDDTSEDAYLFRILPYHGAAMTIWKIQSAQGLMIGTCPQEVAQAITHLLTLGCGAVSVLREEITEEMFAALKDSE